MMAVKDKKELIFFEINLKIKHFRTLYNEQCSLSFSELINIQLLEDKIIFKNFVIDN